jgi:hypothetical protein
MERVLLKQLQPYLLSSKNFPEFQSAFRPYHSTETALNCVFNELYENMNLGNLSLLVSIDLSAAFDLVNHDLLISCLETTFGIHEPTLSLIRTFLTPRTMVVSYNNQISRPIDCCVGVPQGSVLGPSLFSCYGAPVTRIPKDYNLSYHYYADDLF